MGITGGGRTLVVNLVADTKKFGTGINNAKRDIGGLRGSINRLGAMAGPALAGAILQVTNSWILVFLVLAALALAQLPAIIPLRKGTLID